MRWRQQEALDQEGNDRNANAVRVALEIPQPKCSEIYYSVCGSIDQHNRHRQDTLKIETKIETKSWDKRVRWNSEFVSGGGQFRGGLHTGGFTPPHTSFELIFTFARVNLF